jgi:hypothetical protein
VVSVHPSVHTCRSGDFSHMSVHTYWSTSW